MSAFFVTATGTDIGKTFVTAGLVAAMKRRERSVAALKPVTTGFDAAHPALSDPGLLLTALGRELSEENLAGIAPWRFTAPLAPDMAAAREGRLIDVAALTAFTSDAVARCTDALFIEGVGGIMVPLTTSQTTLDWMADVNAPLILVTGSYLGAMSHTLSAVDVVMRRGLRIAALVVNESAGSPVRLDETAETLRHFVGTPMVCIQRDSAAVASAFDRLAETIAV